MAAITLSKAEYLVILDILHANDVYGLEEQPLIPADRETHLALIHQGIRQLESRGYVEIKRGRHIIERRLLEMVAIVAGPQVVIKTLRDRAGIGTQLYLHYQADGGVVEQMLPEEGRYSLGQLPNILSALDRIVRLLDLPTVSVEFLDGQPIDRNHLYDVQASLEAGDASGAMAGLVSTGWPADFAESYLAGVSKRELAGRVTLAAITDGRSGETADLMLIHDENNAWLLTTEPENQNRLYVRQANAATFRHCLEDVYSAVYPQAQEKP